MSDENVKEDIARIVFLSKKCDYTNLNNVLDIIHKYDNRDVFSSAFGQRYMKRIKDIAIGMNRNRTCVLCNHNIADNNVVCAECMSKISDAISKSSQADEYKYVDDYRRSWSPRKKLTAGIIAGVVMIALVLISLRVIQDRQQKASQMDLIDYIGLEEDSYEGAYEDSCFGMGEDGLIEKVRIDKDNDKRYSIAGVHVGDDVPKMRERMALYGAKINPDEKNVDAVVENYLINQNGRIYNIRFYVNEGLISGIEGSSQETADKTE